MSTDKADITTRLRQTRANMLGTEDEQHYWDCHEAAAEIERLRRWGRLTDAEREAIGWAIAATAGVSLRAETMRGLLERMK
jgi:hypothetical protein